MATIIQRNRRSLLPLASVPQPQGVPVTGAIRVGAGLDSARIYCATHGLSIGDWALVEGFEHPWFNGLHQVTGTLSGSFDFQMPGDPGSAPASYVNVFARKLVMGAIWGDGSSSTLGAIKTGLGGTVHARLAHHDGVSIAAGTVLSFNLFYSDGVGPTNVWHPHNPVPWSIDGRGPLIVTAEVRPGAQFVAAAFWSNVLVGGSAPNVWAEIAADEDTQLA